MSKESVANLIRSRFKTLIADVLTVTTLYDNSPPVAVPTAKHVRLNIVWGDGEQVSFGSSSRHRTVGMMVAMIRIPVGNGDKEALALADSIESAFTKVTLSGYTTFRTPALDVQGRKGKWWQVDVICPFYTDSFIS